MGLGNGEFWVDPYPVPLGVSNYVLSLEMKEVGPWLSSWRTLGLQTLVIFLGIITCILETSLLNLCHDGGLIHLL